MTTKVDAEPLTAGGVLILLVLILAGLVFMGSGMARFFATRTLLHTGRRAVGFVAAAIDPSAAQAHPVVTFTATGGLPVKFIQNGYEANPHHEQVEVIYDPRQPATTAVVNNFQVLWMWSLVSAGFGTLLLSLAGVSLLMIARDG